jgi:hypothetical protein
VREIRQPVERGHVVARDTVLRFRGGPLEMRNTILKLSPTELKLNAKAIFKTYELFIKDTYITVLIHLIKGR